VADDTQLLLPGGTSRAAAIRRWLAGTFAGRALAAGAALKLVAFVLGLATQSGVPGVMDTIGDVGLVVGAAIVAYRLFVDVRRRLLWRVRRKLTISYIFIGFVPALLIISFFLLGGVIFLFNVGAYVMTSRLDALVQRARYFADSAAIELEQVSSSADAARVLERRYAVAQGGQPLTSFAVVDSACGRGSAGRLPPVTAGPWTHAMPPQEVPAWVPCEGYAGFTTYTVGPRTRAAVRAVAWVALASSPRAVIVDLPIDAVLIQQLREATGITLNGVTPLPDNRIPDREGLPPGAGELEAVRGSERLPWPALVEYRQWETGTDSTLMLQIRLSVFEVYNRLSGPSTARFDNMSFGQVMLLLLALVAVLFLIIQGVAFLMGLGLARSITGAIHELFVGTERVRRGDFSHKIGVRTRDQLGELASSFNSMTASIEDLLREKADKERLEQELRIARSIQMSLLPAATFQMPGIGLHAHCEPAREVGGDYYDFLPIDDTTLGVMVADVSGKGTSAALYMAELKGIVLSLSQRHTSPRQLLIDANKIISRHLDSRSFITVSYLLVDLKAMRLHYARAGHCPMIYVPGPYAESRAPQILAPDGMVLGLTIDDGTMFTRLLDEVELPLGPGDLFLLYTDGMSEAMNADGDCFGDSRLAEVMHEHANLPSDALLARLLDEVTSFAGSAVQQDDMTMVLLRVEPVGAQVITVTA
jgi:sigma-B regulation protein RsbU (phosphoserine phosphatase)